MKKYSIIALILTSLLVTAYLVFINKINISIRLSELAASLQELDKNESNIDHIGLIATYEINKKIYENRIQQEEADTLEQVVDSLVVKEKNYPSAIQTQYGFLSLPGIWIINFNRKILGKNPLYYKADTGSTSPDLDMAYYYERNYLFEHAIKRYEKALEERTLSSTFRASILLHQGYCYALAGINDKARANYLAIMEKFPQESSAITAAILLKYLEGFQLARDRILGSDADPLTMSQDLMNLLAYKQAMQILKEAEKKASPDDLPRIKYFMARCYTGMGQPDKAIESHLEVITRSPSSDYARDSNRKILLIGTRSGDKKIIAIAKKVNTRLKDPVFDQMVIEQEKTGNTEELTGVVKIDLPQKMIDDVDKYTKTVEDKPAAQRELVILTSDGNTFKGILVKETSAEVVLETSIGTITVKREKITRITGKE
ncbi:MAG TPA: tetratricopeptide repeat protein [Spirochaetota bacterium]|nr:tetratricopeptide repeat protein [Spirochaetota bacterium]